MGPELVVKSLELIWRNLGSALRATAVPLGIGLGLAVLLLLALSAGDGLMDGLYGETGVPTAMGVVALLCAALCAGFGFLWAAVAWHRFVLLEEVPGIVPAVHGDRLGAYLWGWIRLIGPFLLIGLVIGALVAVIAGVAGAAGSPGLAMLLFFGVNVLAVYATLRFSLVLPAAAVGRFIGVFESWRMTKTARDAILIAAALLSVLNAVIGLAGSVLGLAGWAGTLLSFGVSWFGFVLGLSILTAIYGHVVEGRPLT